MARIITAPGIVKNIDRYLNTMRKVPFAVGVSDWIEEEENVYTAEFTSEYVSSSSFELATYDHSVRNSATGDIDIDKKDGGGGMVLTTNSMPTGTISGTLYVFDNNDNKIPVILEDTVIDFENGGTGASNLAGAQHNLGIDTIQGDVETLNGKIANLVTYSDLTFTTNQYGNVGLGINHSKVISVSSKSGWYRVALISEYYNGNAGINVSDTNGNTAANTSVDVRVWHLPL